MKRRKTYFARNEHERKFDDERRESIAKYGSKADRELYLQNQEILNIIRENNEILKDIFAMVKAMTDE